MIAGGILFDKVVYRKELTLCSANIIKWFEYSFEVKRHRPETSTFEVEIEFHVLFCVMSRLKVFWLFFDDRNFFLVRDCLYRNFLLILLFSCGNFKRNDFVGFFNNFS